MRGAVLAGAVGLVLVSAALSLGEAELITGTGGYPAPAPGTDAANAAFAFDPFIPLAMPEADWAALSEGLTNYWQVRIPYRPVYWSPYKPRFRRTRRLEDSPWVLSPTDPFGDPTLYTGVDSPRL